MPESREIELPVLDESEYVFEEDARSFWKPTREGENILGRVIGKSDLPKGPVALIRTGGGILMVGNKAAFEKIMQYEGQVVRVTYLGDVRGNRGFTYKSYRVEHAVQKGVQ